MKLNLNKDSTPEVCKLPILKRVLLSGSDSKSVCLQCRRLEFNPWVGKISWRRKWQRTPVFLPGKSHGRRSMVGYSPRGCKELDTTERLHSLTHSLTHSLILCIPYSLSKAYTTDNIDLILSRRCYMHVKIFIFKETDVLFDFIKSERYLHKIYPQMMFCHGQWGLLQRGKEKGSLHLSLPPVGAQNRYWISYQQPLFYYLLCYIVIYLFFYLSPPLDSMNCLRITVFSHSSVFLWHLAWKEFSNVLNKWIGSHFNFVRGRLLNTMPLAL